MAPTYVGDFQLKGADLRKRGLNRIGNMLVPNRCGVRAPWWWQLLRIQAWHAPPPSGGRFTRIVASMRRAVLLCMASSRRPSGSIHRLPFICCPLVLTQQLLQV